MPDKRPRSPSTDEDTCDLVRGYNSLPTELKDYCFELACAFLAPPSSSAPHPLYDIRTCLELSLVSKHHSERVSPLLYRQVSIARPSALYALRQTLRAKPERGKLIKNLHIGNTTALPAHWWPLSMGSPHEESDSDHPTLSGASTHPTIWLSSTLDEERLPSGCVPRQAWSLDGRTSGCREAAVREALRVAQSSLRVNLQKEGNASGPVKIGAVFEVQAALDLYLDHLRQLEEARPELRQLARPGARVALGCRRGRCEHYPALVLTPILERSCHARERELRSPGAFLLSRATLLRHLARPGSTTDRFDHPLALTRSGYDVFVDILPPDGAMERYDEIVGARYEIDGEEQFLVDERDWSDRSSLSFADIQEVQIGSGAALNDALLKTATLGLNLDLAGDVLRLSPHVTNLSLTGSLQRALYLQDLNQDGIRRATIGPSPPWWDIITDPDIAGLEHVEELRIGGTLLCTPDREIIATMSKLRKLESSMGEPWQSRWVESVVENVASLASMPVPANAADQGGMQGRQGFSANDEDQQPSDEDPHLLARASPLPSSSDVPPLTIVRLHTADVDRVLATASTPEVREAWLHGRAVEGFARRLKLVAKNIEARGLGRPAFDDTEPAWDVLYQEGRDWWLEGAV